jgi:DNA-binding winged helix-turn-helix (wHTH) protein
MEEEFKVYTLGNFRVILGEQELKKNRKKLSKRWQLFQYLITFRNREVSREELITNLKLNKNENPEGALSSLVYRLRKVLNSKFSKRNYIETAGTAYTFNNNIDCWLDIESLENLCDKSLQVVEESGSYIIQMNDNKQIKAAMELKEFKPLSIDFSGIEPIAYEETNKVTGVPHNLEEVEIRFNNALYPDNELDIRINNSDNNENNNSENIIEPNNIEIVENRIIIRLVDWRGRFYIDQGGRKSYHI